MITAKTALEPLYYFMQMGLHGTTERMKEVAFTHAAANMVFDHLKTAHALSLKEVLVMPETEMRVIHELLTQYVMFLTMFPDLPFPDDFLQGTSEIQLGKPWLEYFLERRFPFPQLLPQ